MKHPVAIIAALLAVLAIAYATVFVVVRSGIPADSGPWFSSRRGSLMVHGDDVERSPGTLYGWSCDVLATDRPEWRDSLTVPAALDLWSNPWLISVSEDRRTATCSGVATELAWDGTFRGFCERICFVRRYHLENTWTVGPGDPLGDYRFTVTIDGKTTTRVMRMQEPRARRWEPVTSPPWP